MKTFILLTFGFLGFAFYELSGGADFEPASARVAEVPAEQVPEATPAPKAPEPVAIASTDSITKIDTSASVTRVAVDLTSVGDAAAIETPSEPARSTARVIDSTETPQIILPSLIATTNTDASNASAGDVRIVSGNRVNVRGGPSTQYSIISKLVRGDEVRILEDNGDGWVLMQPLDGGESGWMADFLLTSG